MKTKVSINVLTKIMISIFLLACFVSVGCFFFGFGGSSDGSSSHANTGFNIIKGKIILATSGSATSQRAQNLTGNISAAGSEVWLEDLPDFPHAIANASGVYNFNDVPSGNHIIVASLLVNGEWQKAKSQSISSNSSSTSIEVPTIQLEKATSFVTGVLKDKSGKPLPQGTNLILWGQKFTVGINGEFKTPTLPNSVASAEILVQIPGSSDYTSFVAPVTDPDSPAYIEQTVLSSDSDNHAPSGILASTDSTGKKTVKCLTNSAIYLSLTPFDPDSSDSGFLNFKWSATNGKLSVDSDKLNARWTAMSSSGVATISVLITDSHNATSKVSLRLLVGQGVTLSALHSYTPGGTPYKSITSFVLADFDPTITGVIDESAKTIDLYVPHGTDVTALTPTILHTGVGISPSSGATKDFTDPVIYKVTAENSSTQDYTVTVTVSKAKQKRITAFDFNNLVPKVKGVVDNDNRTIALTVPYGTDVTSLVPTISFKGSYVTPAAGIPQNFTNPVIYKVYNSHGKKRKYTVTVTVSPSSEKRITGFHFYGLSPSVDGVIDDTNSRISVTVPYGTDVSALVPTIDYVGSSTVPESDVVQNFSNSIVYTVTAADNSNKVYNVTVSVAADPTKKITSFIFPSLSPEVVGDIDETDHTVELIVPHGTDISSLAPTIEIDGASISPQSGVTQDFNDTVTYTVTAKDASTQDYDVKTKVSKSKQKRITSFIFNNFTPPVDGVIDQTAHTIDLTVPFGADVTSLIPTITYKGDSVSPASGNANNFTNSVVYTVTAANGSTKDYTVNVTVAPDTENSITDFEFLDFITPVVGNIDQTSRKINLTVPYGTDLSKLVPSITHTGAGIDPASGIANDFTTLATYTVTASSGATKDYSVEVKEAPAITSFNFADLNPEVIGLIDQSRFEISLVVPRGTDLTTLTPTIIHTGASVTPNSGVTQDFTDPITYTVSDDNGVSQSYTVTVSIAKKRTKDITSFVFNGLSPAVNGDIDTDAQTVNVTVPYGTDVTNLLPTITHNGASISPDSGVAQDFTNPITYTVTAENGSTKDYTVTVVVAKNNADNLISFDFDSLTPKVIGSVNQASLTVDLTVPYGTDVTHLVPTITHGGASISPSSGVEQDFSASVTYTVTADDSSTKDYVINVYQAPNPSKSITSFKFSDLSPEVIGSIDDSAQIVDLTVPYGTDVTALVPTITHTGASIQPNSGVAQDFTNPVTYTVTADDGTTKDYNVTVTVAKNSAKNITEFKFSQLSPEVIGNISNKHKTIDLSVPYGTDIASLVPTITHTGQSVSPSSGVANDFTNTVTYTVTAANGSTKSYDVTVTVLPNSAKSITSFKFSSLSPEVTGTIDEANSNINLTVPYGTDITNLVPTIVHNGASISPDPSLAQDFSNPVDYTVTADDNTTKTYAVSVTIAANTAKDITDFRFAALSPEVVGNIDSVAHTISLTVPYNTDMTSLVPTITHSGASISPKSGIATDFTNPVVYTVTADDLSTQQYTVSVASAAEQPKKITSVTFTGQYPALISAIIDDSASTIDLTVPKGTDITALSFNFVYEGSSISPSSNSPQDFTNPVTYTVTASDNSTKSYTVTVYVDDATTNYTSANVGDLIAVPNGTFQRDDNSADLTTVTAFRISKYDVTQAQYMAITGAPNPSWGVEPHVYANDTNRPVEGLTWYDAIEFCNKLSIAEGLEPAYKLEHRNPATVHPITGATVTLTGKNGYRLPTEAEWQWAAMGAIDDRNKLFAGSTGSNNLTDYAWYYYNAHNGQNNTIPYYGPHTVGTKLPNELGLYDMTGNVNEWCWDWADTLPSGHLINYTGPTTGTRRALRGGTWVSGVVSCHIGKRKSYFPGTVYGYDGIRLVRN